MQRTTSCLSLATALCAVIGALAVGAEAAPRGTSAPLTPGADLVRPALEQGDPIPGELLVGFRRNAQSVDRAAARRQAGVRVERALRVEGVQLVTVARRHAGADRQHGEGGVQARPPGGRVQDHRSGRGHGEAPALQARSQAGARQRANRPHDPAFATRQAGRYQLRVAIADSCVRP